MKYWFPTGAINLTVEIINTIRHRTRVAVPSPQRDRILCPVRYMINFLMLFSIILL